MYIDEQRKKLKTSIQCLSYTLKMINDIMIFYGVYVSETIFCRILLFFAIFRLHLQPSIKQHFKYKSFL